MSGMEHIIQAVVKDERGEIIGYKIENGDIVLKDQAVTMAKAGGISGVMVSKSKSGEEYLKSMPDNLRNNNLDNLPTISKDDIM